MSYGYPQQGYGQQYPPQGQPPYQQQPYGVGVPPGPPPGHSPYPQQHGGYGAPQGPPMGHHPSHSFGAPPGPPPGQYGAPPGPPPGQFGAPQGPPSGQYGQPQYGAPAQYGSGPPAPPSMGYVPGQVAPMDMSRQADDLRKAMKGFGTDEKALIAILAPMDPLQAAGVRQAFAQRHRRDLIKDIESETSGYFRDGLVAMVRGPLEQDVLNANKAIKGFGTKESILNDVLLGRSNADMNAIKAHYHHVYKKSLESDVKGDLSLKTERLFDMVIAARRNEESSPVIPQQVEADVSELYRATEGSKIGCDQVAVCAILTQRSDGQLRAISQAYRQKYHRELAEVLKSNFSGHMEDALLYILLNAEDRAKHDAQLLEAAMSGMGTKDDLLVNRIVRIHWDKHRMSQARGAYRHFFQRDLADRIRGETRGDYEKLMVAIVQSA
jgi:annexin A7/11